MRLVLTQPGGREVDGRSYIRDMAPLLERARDFDRDDIIVLPELIGGRIEHGRYLDEVRWLAQSCNAWVVGGSNLHAGAHGVINSGVVVGPSGEIAARYEKANSYGSELAAGHVRGRGGARFEVNGVSCLVMICADFWYAPSFAVPGPAPDLVIVPALSVTQRPTPHMARARWRHASVARAYEFAAFVGVSDWAGALLAPDGTSSGVAGLAHPNPSQPRHLYRSLGRKRVQAFELDFEAQRDLRVNRAQRGFDLTQHLAQGARA